jgi:competence protein ComEA
MKKLLLVLAMWLAMAGAALAQININTATKEQLDGIKGIGPVKAQAIIDYRTKNGAFKTIDDLEKVKGIGPATMKDIRSQVSVSGGSAPAKADAKSAKKVEAKEPAKADGRKEAKAPAKDAKTDKKAEPKKAARADAKAKKSDNAETAKDEAKKGDAKSDKK